MGQTKIRGYKNWRGQTKIGGGKQKLGGGTKIGGGIQKLGGGQKLGERTNIRMADKNLGCRQKLGGGRQKLGGQSKIRGQTKICPTFIEIVGYYHGFIGRRRTHLIYYNEVGRPSKLPHFYAAPPSPSLHRPMLAVLFTCSLF